MKTERDAPTLIASGSLFHHRESQTRKVWTVSASCAGMAMPDYDPSEAADKVNIIKQYKNTLTVYFSTLPE